MHSSIWSTLYLTMAPSAIILLIAIVLRLAKVKLARPFFMAGLGLLIFPVIFLLGHFYSRYSEMGKRAGTFFVVGQDTLPGRCAQARFDSLQLTMYRNGEFAFNYRPCFADRIGGNWEWRENMMHSYAIFDRLNDSLQLNIPSEYNVDTILLIHADRRYLTFARRN